MKESIKDLILREGSFFFFWEGVGNKNKYHMIKWEALDKPKDFGGLGFMDTRAMNVSFLYKWIFRLDSGEDSMCMRILRKKYTTTKMILEDEKFYFQIRHFCLPTSVNDFGRRVFRRPSEDMFISES